MYFGDIVKDGGWASSSISASCPDRHRQHAPEPRHAVLARRVRPRAGPVTITLPDAGKRFMSMIVINQDHYVPEVVYGPARTPSPKNRSARATCSCRCACWLIPPSRLI